MLGMLKASEEAANWIQKESYAHVDNVRCLRLLYAAKMSISNAGNVMESTWRSKWVGLKQIGRKS